MGRVKAVVSKGHVGVEDPILLALGRDKRSWMLAAVLALGCEYITGALEPVAESDTDTALDEAEGESSGTPETMPVGTTGTSGSATASTGASTSAASSDTLPPGGTDDEGGNATSTGFERDVADASGTSGGSSGGIGETANAGDCCKPGDGIGCADEDIATCVCAIDPWCCEHQWDQVCADLVEDGGCAECKFGPFNEEDTSCCASHMTPSCDNTDVAECVCASDGFCCEVFWDQVCVDKVEELGCGPCDGSVDMMMATDGYESTGPAPQGSTGTG
jgi:hypothetical protein